MPLDGSGVYSLPAGNPMPFRLKPLPSSLLNSTFGDLKDALNSRLWKGGGTMTGTLTLAGNPSGALDAAPKQYVDSALSSLNASNLTSGTIPDARFPAVLPAVSGANLTNLNASNLASGTVPSARVSGAYTSINQVANTLNQADLGLTAASGTSKGLALRTSGSLRWYLFSSSTAESGGNAGSDFALGRYDDAGVFLDTPIFVSRATGAVTIGNGSGIQNINASNLASGTVPDARFPATLPAVSGANLTNLNASALASGSVPPARVTGAYTGINAIAIQLNQPELQVSDSASVNRGFGIRTNGVTRWFLYSPIGPESGGNTGSDLYLASFSDAGDYLASVFSITRATGAITFHVRARTAPVGIAFSATPTFNAQQSNVFYFGTLTGNVTSMTINNPDDGQTIQMRFVQDGTGGRTVALPSGAVVSGSINSAANSVTWLVITYVSSASRWEGTWTRIS